MIEPNDHDRFVLRQRIKLVVNQYEFAVPGDGGDDGEPFCFVEQARFRFKEDIRFFADATKTIELQKVFGASLLRSTYRLMDASGEEVAIAREASLPIALLRRVLGFVPYVEVLADWLPIPYDFEFRAGDRLLGTHRRRRWKWRDVYDIDLEPDAGTRRLDRRLVLAAAVGMDALQAR